jgi:adenosylcobinamide-phosphate synthase
VLAGLFYRRRAADGGGRAARFVVGEVRRWHPLVGFGNLAMALERRLNQAACDSARRAGVDAGRAALTALAALLVAGATPRTSGGPCADAVFLSRLAQPARAQSPIAEALAQHDLPNARRLTSYIVSRDTTSASEIELTRASAESLLENGNDAVFGTLFWFMLAGGPGAVLFRMANTLDAMWGYRTPRLLQFGCCAARIDDALNYIPARLTALSYVLLAPGLLGKRRAWQCWRAQAPAWDSPNAGPVMASGAGALGVQLGGAAIYHGVGTAPGAGRWPSASGADINRAWQLVVRTTALWLAVALINAAQMEPHA